MFDFDDGHLIHRTQQGNTEAFNPLVAKYQSRVYNHILGNVKNTETAKDLTQETFLKAFRVIKTFRFESTFSSWLYLFYTYITLLFIVDTLKFGQFLSVKVTKSRKAGILS